MKNIRLLSLFIFCLFLTAFLVFPFSASAQSGRAGNGSAWIIPIRGDIDRSQTAFVRREARRALSQGAEFLIFEIDTFGGRVDSALQITSFIMSVNKARTVAWVKNSESSMGVSWSAGALIAFSCTDIFMAPGTSMGAAAPVIAPLGGAATAADEKSVAAVRSQIAALAERNNHPVGIALAMVDIDVELWEVSVDGKISALALPDLERLEKAGTSNIERLGVISPAGKLLSLTAGEAQRFGLSSIAENQAALLSSLSIEGELFETSPTSADSVISFLTSGAVQAILIVLGLVMVFLEIQTPGFGFPGITAIIAFLIVFGSSALLGRVGSLEILLFIIGLGCLVIEIFVLPGFGIVGISGFIIIGLSLILSMQDFIIPRFDWEWDLLGRNALVVFAGIVAAVTGIAIIALLGPKTKLFDRLTLKAAITGTAGGPDPESPVAKAIAENKSSGVSGNSGLAMEDEENFAALVGKIGVTDSVLRPSGRAVFDGKVFDVVADGEFVDEGRGIIVTRVRGNRIIVRRV